MKNLVCGVGRVVSIAALLSCSHVLCARISTSSVKQSGPQLLVQGGFAFDIWMGKEAQDKKKVYKTKATSGKGAESVTEKAREGQVNFAIDSSKLEFQVLDRLETLGSLESWLISMSLSGDRDAKTYYIVPRVYAGLIFKQGSMTLGNYPGVEDTMSHGGAELMGGTGGFASTSHSKFVSLTKGCYSRVTLIGDSADTTKIILQSPRLWGVQFGVNYAPDSRFIGRKNRSSDKDISVVDTAYNRHLVGVAVDYVDFVASDIKLSLSVTGMFGKSYASETYKGVDFYDTRGIGAGFVLDFDRFSFGVEGAWMGQSSVMRGDFKGVQPPALSGNPAPVALDYTAKNAQGPRFMDAAFSMFVTNDTKVVLGYYTSWRQTGFAETGGKQMSARAHIVNASLTYQMTKNVQTYVEGFFHHTKNPAAIYEANHEMARASDKKSADVVTDQRAWTFVIGTRLRF